MIRKPDYLTLLDSPFMQFNPKIDKSGPMTSFKVYYVSPTHNAGLWKPIDKRLDAFPQTGGNFHVVVIVLRSTALLISLCISLA